MSACRKGSAPVSVRSIGKSVRLLNRPMKIEKPASHGEKRQQLDAEQMA